VFQGFSSLLRLMSTILNSSDLIGSIERDFCLFGGHDDDAMMDADPSTRSFQNSKSKKRRANESSAII
jgi:hypothetical protein